MTNIISTTTDTDASNCIGVNVKEFFTNRENAFVLFFMFAGVFMALYLFCNFMMPLLCKNNNKVQPEKEHTKEIKHNLYTVE